jgi:hypothetical protein
MLEFSKWYISLAAKEFLEVPMQLKDIAWPCVLVAEIPAHCFILGSISTKFTSFNVRPLPKDPGRPVLGGASIIRRRGEIKESNRSSNAELCWSQNVAGIAMSSDHIPGFAVRRMWEDYT